MTFEKLWFPSLRSRMTAQNDNEFLLYIKLHFRGCTCCCVSGEEGFRGGACESGDEVCGELANGGVVFLDGFVVALAFDGDAVFGAFELHAEFLEALVALEIRVVFGDGH